MVKGVFHVCTNQLKTPHDLTKKKSLCALLCFQDFQFFKSLCCASKYAHQCFLVPIVGMWSQLSYYASFVATVLIRRELFCNMIRSYIGFT